MAPDPDAIEIIRNHVSFDPLRSAGSTPSSWQQLPELPSAAELLNPQATSNDLPTFPIDQSFPSKAHYLEALYKILRFEGIEGLRYSVNDFSSRPVMTDDQNTCVYTKVHTKGYLMSRLGPICRITFSTRRADRRINWKQSKRLLPGKIIALSADNFNKDCRVAVVAQRPFEGGLDQIPPSVDIFWGDAEQAVVDPAQDLVMIESRNGFYEAVRHALTGLQQATGPSTFDKYFVSLANNDDPAGFIAAAPNLNLTSLLQHLTPDQLEQAAGDKHLEQLIFERISTQYRECNILRRLPCKGVGLHTSLDSSQLEAFQRMLSKELAVVQGPPGTGKTFTSVKAIGAMLDNRRRKDPPIIIAAQTNHALDQLLIYCHSAGAKIMRVGGRTENEVIKERTVYNLRNTAGKMPTDGQYRSLEKGRLRIVQNFTSLISEVFGNEGLIDPKALLHAGIMNEAQFKSLTDEDWEGNEDVPPMRMWLGDEVIERIRQQDDYLDFMEEEAADEEVDPNLEDEAVEDDEDRLHGIWVPLTSRYTGKTPRVPSWKSKCIAKLESCDDLYDIPPSLRGGVYQVLQAKLRDTAGDKFQATLNDAVNQAKEQKVNKWSRDLHVIDKHCIDVIGCTTTGLSKYRGFLAATKARVLLIEEAAETREANVTSPLFTFPTIEQLVLVGDHQQLPPQCDIGRLADAPFHLNTSLFERLVHNRIPYTMLNRQRRMVPELRFIVQQYYPKLLDHPIVEDVASRPLIPGMGDRRSWFLTHEWPEETDADCSKYNMQEAQMVVAFMRYLVQNGVQASQITILTYYRGQRKRLLQLLRRDAIFMKTSYFNVATIDSYQGEENEVVLLSLVRSPRPNDIPRVGFLDSQNRATVAISRARRGFFMFGNKNNLFAASDKSFDVWGPVWNGFALQKRVAMSKGLPLICQNHQKEIWVKSPEDFLGNAGGCWTKCNGALPCGHPCALMCHTVSHEMLPCLHPCTKALSCGHKCSGVCTDKCRCAENCREFHFRESEQKMAELQIEGASWDASHSGLTVHDNSPEKWRQFSRDPTVHDNAICQARLQDLAGQAVQTRPLVDSGTPTKTKHGGLKSKAPEAIQERFIPIANQDGHRMPGVVQRSDRVRGDVPRHGRAHQQARRHETQNTRQSGQARQPTKQRRGHPVGDGAHRQQPRPQSQSQPADLVNHDRLLLTSRQARPVGDSVVAESEFGFEAEVLGIRRGGTSQVDTTGLREQFQHHLSQTDDAESLISFEGAQSQGASGNVERTVFPNRNNNDNSNKIDEEPEFLIDL